MIIPRADTLFNRCKSNLKFLEASMLEIPVIAQSFPDGQSPYEVNPKDAEQMILAKDSQGFIEAIEYILSLSKEARYAIGNSAKQYVLENYDINKNAHKWAEAYQTIFDRDEKENKTND